VLLAARHKFVRATGIDVVFKDPQTIAGVEFKNHNLNERWPFEDGSIDHLIAMMVFEHLFDPFHCFEEVRRTLAPGGVAYVNLPLVTSLRNRFRLLAGLLPVTSIGVDRWFDERGWDGNHLHYFSVDSIHRLAKACGLRIVDVRGVGSFHALKTALPTILASELTFSLRHR
jgi:SAM-dependent methyltransferase